MLVNSIKSLLTLLTLSFFVSLTSEACINGEAQDGIVPKNNLKIPSYVKSVNGITKEVFDQVITNIESIYAPIVSEKGGNLTVVRNWDDATVNAYAQRSGKEWKVSMFGGLARHETVTADGFALVVCHEIGHHIGGAPKKASMFGSAWASNEGQSDYFATSKCLRKYFQEFPETEDLKLTAPAIAQEKCMAVWGQSEDHKHCIRGAMAGASLANLFAALRTISKPEFATPDPKVVTKTDDNHPAAQCRMDTYFNGALCSVSDTVDFSDKDEQAGACFVATGIKVGSRPLCWFKPKARRAVRRFAADTFAVNR